MFQFWGCMQPYEIGIDITFEYTTILYINCLSPMQGASLYI